MDNTEMIQMITETATRSKHNEQEIERIQSDIVEIKRENQAIHDIATSVKLIAQDVSYIKGDIGAVKKTQTDLRTELSEVKNNSTKTKAFWYDKAVGAVCGAIGMAILGYVLSNVFPVLFK